MPSMTPEEYEVELRQIGKLPVKGRIIPCKLPCDSDEAVPCNNCDEPAIAAFQTTSRQQHVSACQVEFKVALCESCIDELCGILLKEMKAGSE